MEFKSTENRLVARFKSMSRVKKVILTVTLVLVLLIIIGAIAVSIYIQDKFSKIDTQEIKDEEIIINEEVEKMKEADLGTGYTNFVLFGGDSRSGDVKDDLNTDSIIIASLNNETKEIKLISVYRDTLLDLTNGSIQKCNSAYRRGGAAQAINMLNMNLDLDIKKYITVNWSIVAEVVDMLGGIEVELSEAEVKAVNKYIRGTAGVVGKKAVRIKKAGLQNLDGVQAATYARIRKGVGDDYARTGRQRLIVKLAAEKAMKADLKTINKIIDKVFPQISTNLTVEEVLKYVSLFNKYTIGEASGFPFHRGNEMLGSRGSCVYAITLKSNVQELHEFLYGKEDYQPSSKVRSISDRIQYLVYSIKNEAANGAEEDTEEKTTVEKEETTTEHKEPAKPDTTTEESTTESEATEETEPESTTESGTTEETKPESTTESETMEATKTESTTEETTEESTTESTQKEEPVKESSEEETDIAE